jgi:hypothetical protein
MPQAGSVGGPVQLWVGECGEGDRDGKALLVRAAARVGMREQFWLRLRHGYRDLFLRTVMIFLMRLRTLGGRILLVTL